MPLKLTRPNDIEARLAGLGDALAGVSEDIDFAYLFGSTADGRATSRSDVDFAVYVSGAGDHDAVRLDVARAAAKQLGTDAVDVVLLNTAPISLAGRVLTTRRVILDRRPFVRHQYESLVARMFQDFRVREHRLLTQRYAHG